MLKTNATADSTAIPEIHTQSVADELVNQLQQIGVEYVFGVPGGAIEPLFDALARQMRQPISQRENTNHLMKRRLPRQQRPLRTVIARHEAGAAFMADGYTRETGQMAVCCATTGPGTTNLITGVASAYSDRVPMLVITAQTALPNFGRRGFQESSSDAVDTVAILEHCTKYSSLVSHPQQLAQKLNAAVISAYQPPRGPVHLSIPIDVLRSAVDSSNEVISIAHMLRAPKVVDTQGFDALWHCVSSGKKLAVLLGAEAGTSIEPVIRFAEQTASPVITTPMGKRWISAFHPLNHGVFGFAGHDSARFVLNDPEVKYILAVGTPMGELSTAGWSEEYLLNHKLIHIDANMENFSRSPMACLHVYGNISLVFTELLHSLKQTSPALSCTQQYTPDNHLQQSDMPPTLRMLDKAACYSDAVPLKPQRVMYFLGNYFPEETRVICDTGNSWAWATHYLHLRHAKHYHIGMGFGSMAWAIGAAVGVALAHDGVPTICLTGDGSFLMSGQELTVAIQQRLPVIFIVLNDQSLGMIKHGQRLGGGEPVGFDLPEINFAAMAESMGARGYVIRTQDDMDELDVVAICQHQGPTLLDVHIDPEEVPPMGERIGVLKSA